MASVGRGAVRPDAARAVAVIRIDAAWLATAPLDMRAGTDTALARVIATFGAAHPHHAYVFANQRVELGVFQRHVRTARRRPDELALAAHGLARRHHRDLNLPCEGVVAAIGRCANGLARHARAHCCPW